MHFWWLVGLSWDNWRTGVSPYVPASRRLASPGVLTAKADNAACQHLSALACATLTHSLLAKVRHMRGSARSRDKRGWEGGVESRGHRSTLSCTSLPKRLPWPPRGGSMHDQPWPGLRRAVHLLQVSSPSLQPHGTSPARVRHPLRLSPAAGVLTPGKNQAPPPHSLCLLLSVRGRPPWARQIHRALPVSRKRRGEVGGDSGSLETSKWEM